jgi:hypothetical protein
MVELERPPFNLMTFAKCCLDPFGLGAKVWSAAMESLDSITSHDLPDGTGSTLLGALSDARALATELWRSVREAYENEEFNESDEGDNPRSYRRRWRSKR